MKHSDKLTNAPALLSKAALTYNMANRSTVTIKIDREHGEPFYRIQLDEGKRLLAVMDFNALKRFSVLTIHNGDKDSPTIGVSHMPWTASEIHLGLHGSDPVQGTQWEDVKRQIVHQEWANRYCYEWTTPIAGGEKDVRLVWVHNIAEGAFSQSYTLLDLQNKTPLAEFVSKQALFTGTGGTLKISETWLKNFSGLDVKVLLAALSIYETRRRKAHRIAYRPTQWKAVRALWLRDGCKR